MNEPKIRFQGFEGEWKSGKIEEVAALQGGYAFQSASFCKDGIPIVRIANILNSGEIGGTFVFYEKGAVPSQFILSKGDAVIAMSGATTGKTAVVKDNRFYYQNQRVGKFGHSGEIYYPFVATFIQSCYFVSKLQNLLSSSAQPNISTSDVNSIQINVPKVVEQRAIASYFTNLDTLITSSASRLASLKQMKSASLQAMFPQEGETVPKIRFKGFEGEWEKVKLGEIGCFGKGRGYSKSDIIEVGTPLFLYGRLYTKYSFFTDKVDTYAQLKDGSIISDGDEVVLPASGETPEDIACASAILSKGIILGGDLNIIKVDLQRYVTPFVALAISNGSTHYELSKFAQGKSVVHLQNSEIKNGSVMIPSLPEQQAIASYFTSLDKQIALQSQRLEKLKQIKSACLDKMFV